MKRILFLVNHYVVIYNFRLELLRELKRNRYDVYISTPYDEKNYRLEELGCHVIQTEVNRHGKNMLEDFKLLNTYIHMIKEIKPDVVLSYTIKPNIYGGMAAERCKVPFIPTITGLGTAVENESIVQKMIMLLYKCSLRNAQVVFFQNESNLHYLKEAGVIKGKYKLVNGSGVNLEHFSVLPYPKNEKTEIVFIGRVMRDKGIEEFLYAACEMKKQYSDVEFHVCGFCEDSYEERIKEFIKKGIIQYHGMIEDIREVLKYAHCTVLPSYHEGMSNVLLESAAAGRPIIASAISGCKETFVEGKSGYGVEVRNKDALKKAVERFYGLQWEEKARMGEFGRKLMEEQFDRNKIVAEYMKQIENIEEGK